MEFLYTFDSFTGKLNAVPVLVDTMLEFNQFFTVIGQPLTKQR